MRSPSATRSAWSAPTQCGGFRQRRASCQCSSSADTTSMIRGDLDDGIAVGDDDDRAAFVAHGGNGAHGGLFADGVRVGVGSSRMTICEWAARGAGERQALALTGGQADAADANHAVQPSGGVRTASKPVAWAACSGSARPPMLSVDPRTVWRLGTHERGHQNQDHVCPEGALPRTRSGRAGGSGRRRA